MPVEVHFHGLEKSAAVEERVRDKVGKLAKHFDRMTHCRVVVEAPHRNPQRPKIYQIKIEVGVPGRSPIVVSHEREGSDATEDWVWRSAMPEAALRSTTCDQISQRSSSAVGVDPGERHDGPGSLQPTTR
jgi:ribosome-associated translation inhibitor RaiA